MSRAALRVVRGRAPRRPSCIVDLTTGAEPRFTCPWTIAEIMVMQTATIPQRVTTGMYLAAWARAEACDLTIFEGRLEPSCRYEPSLDLWMSCARGIGDAVGVLGFGFPIRFRRDDDGSRHVYIGWSRDYQHGRS